MIDLIDHGPVRELRLAKPPANAFDPELVAALHGHVSRAPTEGARAIVISGAPGMFSAGLDVPALITLDREDILDFWRAFYALLGGVAASEIPVGAALTGHSPAGGAVLAVFCDYRVMAEGRYKIGMNEVQVGLAVPHLIQYATKRLVGVRQGDHLLIGGRLVLSEEALCLGLVDEVVPEGEVVGAAIAWAESLLSLPPKAMLETRRRARQDLVSQFEQIGDSEYREMASAWFSVETRATIQALVQRLTGKS